MRRASYLDADSSDGGTHDGEGPPVGKRARTADTTATSSTGGSGAAAQQQQAPPPASGSPAPFWDELESSSAGSDSADSIAGEVGASGVAEPAGQPGTGLLDPAFQGGAAHTQSTTSSSLLTSTQTPPGGSPTEAEDEIPALQRSALLLQEGIRETLGGAGGVGETPEGDAGAAASGSRSTTPIGQLSATPPPIGAAPPASTPFISMMCADLSRYKVVRKISEGGYGIVSKGYDVETKRAVALKRIKFGAGQGEVEDGVHISALREITTLLSISHSNIVKVHQAVCGESSKDLVLVMEYVEHDVRCLLSKHEFTVPQVKCLMKQLLAAVGYLHDRWIIHRDLKTNNLLYGNNGVLKLCDFGMARLSGEPLRPYTPLQWVLTLPFRPPEGLLGAKRYDESIDMWGVGCVFAEMLERAPLFHPKTHCPEVEMLDQIFSLLGTPTQKQWPELDILLAKRPDPFTCQTGVQERRCLNIEGYALKRPRGSKGDFVKRFGKLVPTAEGRGLLQSLLAINPKERISAATAFSHPFFEEAPMRCSACDMPDFTRR